MRGHSKLSNPDSKDIHQTLVDVDSERPNTRRNCLHTTFAFTRSSLIIKLINANIMKRVYPFGKGTEFVDFLPTFRDQRPSTKSIRILGLDDSRDRRRRCCRWK